jgi:hypothetical protein
MNLRRTLRGGGAGWLPLLRNRWLGLSGWRSKEDEEPGFPAGYFPPCQLVGDYPRTRFGCRFRTSKSEKLKFKRMSPDSGTESKKFSLFKEPPLNRLVRMKDGDLNLAAAANHFHRWQKGYWMRCEVCNTVVEGDLESEETKIGIRRKSNQILTEKPYLVERKVKSSQEKNMK